MPATDLHAEALTVALRDAPPEIGVAIFPQFVNAPAPNGGKPGPVCVWHLVMTMSNPAALAGPKLRHYAFIGDGAPDLASLPGEVSKGLVELRTLARQKLSEAQ